MKGKEYLYQGFNELIKIKPFSEITISEIVKYSNVNRNTFYYHFKDLESFLKSFFKDEFADQIQELIKNNKIREGYQIMIDYSKTHKELMKESLANPSVEKILVVIFHNEIRLDVAKILINYQESLHINLHKDFICFFSHRIVDEFLAAPKQIVFDDMNIRVLEESATLYIDAIPEKLLKVSKVNFD